MRFVGRWWRVGHLSGPGPWSSPLLWSWRVGVMWGVGPEQLPMVGCVRGAEMHWIGWVQRVVSVGVFVDLPAVVVDAVVAVPTSGHEVVEAGGSAL